MCNDQCGSLELLIEKGCKFGRPWQLSSIRYLLRERAVVLVDESKGSSQLIFAYIRTWLTRRSRVLKICLPGLPPDSEGTGVCLSGSNSRGSFQFLIFPHFPFLFTFSRPSLHPSGEKEKKANWERELGKRNGLGLSNVGPEPRQLRARQMRGRWGRGGSTGRSFMCQTFRKNTSTKDALMFSCSKERLGKTSIDFQVRSKYKIKGEENKRLEWAPALCKPPCFPCHCFHLLAPGWNHRKKWPS